MGDFRQCQWIKSSLKATNINILIPAGGCTQNDIMAYTRTSTIYPVRNLRRVMKLGKSAFYTWHTRLKKSITG